VPTKHIKRNPYGFVMGRAPDFEGPPKPRINKDSPRKEKKTEYFHLFLGKGGEDT
jgi:hypothetical protein